MSPRRGQLRPTAPALLLVILALVVTACSTAARSQPPAGDGPYGCPKTITYRQAWAPESTQWAFRMLRPGTAKIDRGKGTVTGDLIDADGTGTGLRLELRFGGPAVAFQPQAALFPTHRDELFGTATSDDQVNAYANGQQHMRALLAPYDTDMLAVMWDADRHPEWRTIQNVGVTDYRVLWAGSAPGDGSAQYLTGVGILRETQMQYGYDGSPAQFLAHPDIAVSGFATNELYQYSTVHGHNMAYQYVTEAGYPNYRNQVVVRDDDVTRFASCFARLIPLMQRHVIAYGQNPAPTLPLIVDAARQLSPFPYSLAQAAFGADRVQRDGLIADSVSGGVTYPFGSVMPDRVGKVLDILAPIYAGEHAPVAVPRGPTGAAQFIDNSFLDPRARFAA